MKKMLAFLALTACTSEALKTPEGCPVYMSELMQAETRACQAAYHEELARQRGGVVTKCFPTSGGTMTCSTY